MHRNIFLVLLVMGGLAFGAHALQRGVTPDQEALVAHVRQPLTMQNTAVPAEEFEQMITSGQVTLIDVRTPEEYATGHLADATLVDFSATDFLERMSDLSKEASYALYCRSGNRSGQARALLAEAGFTNVVDLAGGVNDWQARGYSLCTDC